MLSSGENISVEGSVGLHVPHEHSLHLLLIASTRFAAKSQGKALYGAIVATDACCRMARLSIMNARWRRLPRPRVGREQQHRHQDAPVHCARRQDSGCAMDTRRCLDSSTTRMCDRDRTKRLASNAGLRDCQPASQTRSDNGSPPSGSFRSAPCIGPPHESPLQRVVDHTPTHRADLEMTTANSFLARTFSASWHYPTRVATSTVPSTSRHLKRRI